MSKFLVRRSQSILTALTPLYTLSRMWASCVGLHGLELATRRRLGALTPVTAVHRESKQETQLSLSHSASRESSSGQICRE